MKQRLFPKLSLLFVLGLFLQNSFSQDYTRWGLPDGAKARLGKGWIHDFAYSPDGTQLAVATHIGIWLYDAHTMAELRLLTGQNLGFLSVAYSPDGRTVASGSQNGRLWLWDATTGEHKHSLEGHTQAIWSVVFSLDNGMLASGSDDNTIRLWDATTGRHLRTLEGHTDWVRTIAYSPDGDILASGSWDRTIRLWDATTGEHKQILKGPKEITLVAYSPDGLTLASGSGDQTIQLWDASTGKYKQTLEGYASWSGGVAYSLDGNTIAGASYDATIRLWDTTTGEHRQTLEGHEEVSTIVYAPDGEPSLAEIIARFISGRLSLESTSRPLKGIQEVFYLSRIPRTVIPSPVVVGMVQFDYGMPAQANTSELLRGIRVGSIRSHMPRRAIRLQVGVIAKFGYGILPPGNISRP